MKSIFRQFRVAHIMYGALLILLAANLSVEIGPAFSKRKTNALGEIPASFGIAEIDTEEDSLVIIQAPEAEEIIVGMPYRTQFTVARIPRNISASYTSSMGTVSTEDGGRSAELVISTSDEMIYEGEDDSRQLFEATVDVTLPDGSTKQLKVENKFLVKQPNIQFTSPILQKLYRNCGNAIHVDVPELGDYYNPMITSDEAWATPSVQNKRKFLVVPGKASFANLRVETVTNGERVDLGTKRFQVMDPPKPHLEVSLSGGESYQTGQVLKNGMSVYVDVLSDKDFAFSLPMDARYTVGSIEVFLQDDSGLFKNKIAEDIPETTFVSDRKVEMPDEVYKLPKGTWVMYRVIEIKRMNFRGQKSLDERFVEQERSFLFVKG